MDEIRAAVPAEGLRRVDAARLKEWNKALSDYRSGKKNLEARVIASEQWWKLRNAVMEEAEGATDSKGFKSSSAWLHNVIVSKHADAAEAYPQPSFLPREATDREEAAALTAIVPVILEQNGFRRTYLKAWWRKLKSGTSVYKVVWDGRKLNGLGDIGVMTVNLLNVYWEPGVEDIQQSRYFFHTELADRELIAQEYPQAAEELKGKDFQPAKFLYDDRVPTDEKITVVEIYYHVGSVLHYCKYVGETVLYATENDPELAERGLYDHGLYPFVFDPMFPIEGSPCGYGFVDICRNPQTEIDLMNTAFLHNAMAGATPRFFVKGNGDINEAELLDLTKPVVHVTGKLDDESVRPIESRPLQGNYMSVLEGKIMEMRETSGNTETATGSASSGVTAASAIAALQEASGKGSRDAIRASYDVFADIVKLCVELIRQFYDAPRKFRITNQMGREAFITYKNTALQMQEAGMAGGQQLLRKPEFDIEVVAQKENAYTTIANNEMALQFFQLGFFDPARVDQTLMCLELMDFKGKAEVLSKVQQLGTMADKLKLAMQYAAALAAKHGDKAAMQQLAGMAGMGGWEPMMTLASPVGKADLQNAAGGYEGKKEHALVEKSREQAREASQPGGGV